MVLIGMCTRQPCLGPLIRHKCCCVGYGYHLRIGINDYE